MADPALGEIYTGAFEAKVQGGRVNAGHKDFTGPHDTSTRSGRASVIQDAIDYAEDNGDLPFVMAPDNLLNWDASAVNYSGTGGTWTGRMVREGQIAEGHDIEAYGAAPSNTKSSNTDAFIAATEAAESTSNRVRRVVGTRSGTFLVERRGFEIITVNADDVEIRLFDGVEIKLADNEAGGSYTRMLHIGTSSHPSNVKVKGGTWNQNRANNTGGGNQSNDALMTYAGSGEGVKFEDIDFRNSIGVHLNIQGAGTAEADWGEDALVEGCTFKGGGDGIFVKRWRDFRILGSSFRDFDEQDAIEPVGPGEQGVIADCNFYGGSVMGSAVDIFDTGSGTFDYVTVESSTIVLTKLQGIIVEGEGHIIDGVVVLNANQENSGGGGSGRASIDVRPGSVHVSITNSVLLSDGAADRPVQDSGDYTTIVGNTWHGHSADSVDFTADSTNPIVRNNGGQGNKDYYRGTVTITSGNDAKQVQVPSHAPTPRGSKDIILVPIDPNTTSGSHLGNATDYWVNKETYSGNNFGVFLDQDPGQDVQFAYHIIRWDDI